MPGAESRRPFPNRRATHGSAVPHPAPRTESDHASHRHSRPGKADEVALESLNPDLFARLTLALMRWYFQTFASPDTQGWLTALRCATAHVGPRQAGALCYDLVALIQALRAARSSPFRFNPEGCACCRVWLTPEERLLMEILSALREGRRGRAQTLVQLLCDGAPNDDLLAVAEIYIQRHAPRLATPAAAPPA
jgi:hypothetical protein